MSSDSCSSHANTPVIVNKKRKNTDYAHPNLDFSTKRARQEARKARRVAKKARNDIKLVPRRLFPDEEEEAFVSSCIVNDDDLNYVNNDNDLLAPSNRITNLVPQTENPLSNDIRIFLASLPPKDEELDPETSI